MPTIRRNARAYQECERQQILPKHGECFAELACNIYTQLSHRRWLNHLSGCIVMEDEI
jgi:hypothetical protein